MHLTPDADRLLHETTSLCKVCKNAVPAQVVATPAGEVWMRKHCANHGPQEVRLSTSAEWYEQTRAIKPVPAPPSRIVKEVDLGCPFDCGPCTSHEQKVRLPVVTITSACNLDCPICYVHNKNDDAFHMRIEDFKEVLRHLIADHGGELDILNLTGGEPTVHPCFLDFLELARAAGIHRVTLCTNGIRLAKDESLVRELARLGARVALSFDTFDPHVDYLMQGAHLLELKMRCLELLEKHNVDTTLIPVMTHGVNDHEIGKIIGLVLDKPNIRHIEIHTMTFTGQSGTTFPRAGRISMYEVLKQIEATTGGLLTPEDFVPSPCAHSLCYQIAYLLMDPDGGRPVPFSRFMPKEVIYDALAEHLYLEPTPKLERAMVDAINRLWVEDDAETQRTLRLLKSLLNDLFPKGKNQSHGDAMRIGERAIKAVYIHSHMDEETFDTDRAMQCCDSNCYPDGTTVPVCNYNVLYREKEKNFNRVATDWNERSGGRKSLLVALPIL